MILVKEAQLHIVVGVFAQRAACQNYSTNHRFSFAALDCDLF